MPTNIAIGTQENNHMLSVCIITKNEEHNLARCLKSFQNTGFELVVVDTGSTDQTKKIAAEYTENIYDFPWCDDFSAAKNFAVSKAAHPYVMVIDSDEYLQQIDRAGNDIVMPGGPPVIRQILKGYEEGRVTREELEQAVRHLLIMIKRIRLAD